MELYIHNNRLKRFYYIMKHTLNSNYLIATCLTDLLDIILYSSFSAIYAGGIFYSNDLAFFLSGKTVKKEPCNEDGQQQFDEADKLLQEFQDAQVDRVGSRPSSNLSSLSNASERDQHHLGICHRTKLGSLLLPF